MVNSIFIGKGIRLSSNDIPQVAGIMGVEVPALRAVVDVEARSTGFYSSNAPVILYEPHIAYSRTSGAARTSLINAGLAYAKWGQRPYPKTSTQRYAQLYRAIQIAGDKAYEFASYGLPQMMGFNYKACGYPSAKAMFNAFKDSERAQLDAMANFIMANPTMLNALRRKDWAGFAYRYNGPGYKRNEYHTKLAEAYRRRAAGQSSAVLGPLADGMLYLGDKGPEVLELQRDLNRLGYGPLIEDGDFGPMTKQAVMALQKTEGLTIDGKAGIEETLPAVQRRIKALDSTLLHGEPKEREDGLPTPPEGGVSAPVDPVRERMEDGPSTPGLPTNETPQESEPAPGFWERLWGAIKAILSQG